jgi:exopolyphosphatase/guanosine-5'-triphosphate,3'-diphosphate pyrophosphatase
VESFKFERVAFSAYGLREGLIYDAMSSARKADSPLTAGCAALGGRPAAAEELGAALEAWLAKAFGKLEPRFGARDRALLAAACRLADLGTQLHPDHRASLIFEQVLRAPIAGLGHDERVFLACAAFARHTASRDKPDAPIVSRLLSPERYQRARALGAAIRLGCDLSGRSPELLGRTRLDIRPKDLTLQADPGWEEICLGEAVAKRAQTLAGLLNRPLRLKGGLEPARKAG